MMNQISYAVTPWNIYFKSRIFLDGFKRLLNTTRNIKLFLLENQF